MNTKHFLIDGDRNVIFELTPEQIEERLAIGRSENTKKSLENHGFTQDVAYFTQHKSSYWIKFFGDKNHSMLPYINLLAPNHFDSGDPHGCSDEKLYLGLFSKDNNNWNGHCMRCMLIEVFSTGKAPVGFGFDKM